ncbi:MAG: chaperone NapD [Methyloligellaceae bacterium]
MPEAKQSIIARTRRDFITGRVGGESVHIASLLVQAWPDQLDDVERVLTELPGVESHGPAGAGRLIVTVETENDAALVDAVNRIERSEGVITASLVYHHMDQEAGHE